METSVVGAKVPEFEKAAESVSQKATSVRVFAILGKENGEKITERGFVYSTSPSPTLENGNKVFDTGIGIGRYELSIDDLDNNTTYYIRSYAINKIGTGYGTPDLSIVTNEGLATVLTLEPDSTKIRATSAEAGGKLTNIGEDVITKIGVYVFETKNSIKIDTIAFTETVSEGDTYICKLTGLKPDTWYYVQAFVENKYGTKHGGLDSLLTRDGKPKFDKETKITDRDYTSVTLSSSVSNGGDETVFIAERGFCWSNAADPLPDITNNMLQCGEGEGDFEGKVIGLESSKIYYARAFSKSNSGIIVYGELITLWTNSDKPTVQTVDAVVQNGNADVGGVIESMGMSTVFESGICWSISNRVPTISDSKLTLYYGMNNDFSGRLSKLKGGTTYYVRAFATNSQGTGYGEVVQFKTPSIFTDLAMFPGSQRIINSMAYFAINGYLYILGGDLGSSLTDELWRYSIEENKWEDRRKYEGGPMRWLSGTTYGQGAFIYGGWNGNRDEKPGIYYFKEDENHWYYYNGPDSAIVNRTLGYSYSNSVFYVGGFSADTVREDVWSYTPPSLTWQKMTDFPEKQYGGVAVVIDNVAYVGMGRDASHVCNNNLWITSDGANTWEYKTSYPVTGYVLGGVVCNKRMYIVDESYCLIEYNPETDEWTRKSMLNRKTVNCIYAEGNKIYIGLGGNIITMYDPLWDN